MVKLSPSILAADLWQLGDEIQKIEAAGADMLHIDVMDGHFVPNLSFGIPIVKSIRPRTHLPLDVHLMLSKPEKYFSAFAEAGADGITFHAEANCDPARAIEEIHRLGKRAGMSIKPGTPPETVYPYLKDLELVLVMTVEPGFGGQKFMGGTMEKLSTLSRRSREMGLSVEFEVDGGIDPFTAPIAVENGADILVAGSALFGAPDYAAAIARLRESCPSE